MAKLRIHPNNPVVSNPKFAKDVFDASRQPRAWLAVARHLRTSADAIFEKETPIAERFWEELRRFGRANGSSSAEEFEFDEAKFPFPNFDAAYMLVAFAIENLLKGLMLAKGKAEFTSKELPGVLKSHDLQKLHQQAQPNAVISEYVLEHLTYMSEWRARYPLPTSIGKFWPMRGDGTFGSMGFAWPDSHSEFLAYYDHLESELSKII